MTNSTKSHGGLRTKVDVLMGGAEEEQQEVDEASQAIPDAGESEQDSEQEDCMPKVVAKDPGAPTQAEIDEHNVDHIPFRSWCECCVMGRGTGEQHRAGPASTIPVIAFDFLFVTQSKIALNLIFGDPHYTKNALGDPRVPRKMILKNPNSLQNGGHRSSWTVLGVLGIFGVHYLALTFTLLGVLVIPPPLP